MAYRYRTTAKVGEVVAIVDPYGNVFHGTVTGLDDAYISIGGEQPATIGKWCLWKVDVVRILGLNKCRCGKRLAALTHNKRDCPCCRGIARAQLQEKYRKRLKQER